MPDEACRLAKVEQRLDSLVRELNDSRKEDAATIAEISHNVEKLLQQNANQQGYWRGVGVGLTLLVSTVGFAANYFFTNK
jgi:hypothetical protein